MKKGLLSLVLLSACIFTLSGCIDEGNKITKLEITNKPTEVLEGQDFQLETKYTPSDLKNVSLNWESDDDSIATVKDGVVKGVGEGTVTITVSTKKKNAEDSAVINVREEIFAEDIKLDTNEIVLDNNETYELQATIEPEDTDNKDIVWTSSDENIVTVSNGKIKCKEYGTAVITAETANGKKAECNVVVEKYTKEKLEEELSEQPVHILETNYVVQTESSTWKLGYPDYLNAIIENNSDEDIKSAVVAFVAWDSNNLPVKIEKNFDFIGGSYIKEVSYNDINLVSGAKFGEGYGYEVSENSNIDKFKAIIVSYKTFDGETWTNPLYKKFKDFYEDKRLEE